MLRWGRPRKELDEQVERERERERGMAKERERERAVVQKTGKRG